MVLPWEAIKFRMTFPAINDFIFNHSNDSGASIVIIILQCICNLKNGSVNYGVKKGITAFSSLSLFVKIYTRVLTRSTAKAKL